MAYRPLSTRRARRLNAQTAEVLSIIGMRITFAIGAVSLIYVLLAPVAAQLGDRLSQLVP